MKPNFSLEALTENEKFKVIDSQGMDAIVGGLRSKHHDQGNDIISTHHDCGEGVQSKRADSEARSSIQ